MNVRLAPLVPSALLGLALLGAAADSVARGVPRGGPIVIAHRGASGVLPEHTLEGYALAMEMGADYVELDLVMTKDGHLIVRHEPNMIATTDVKDRGEFSPRRRRATVDGVEEDGYFASDFLLAEIKRLRAVQPVAHRPQQFNGKFAIPTFAEVIALAKRKSSELGRPIGVYAETKHATYHRAIGLPLEGKIVAELKRAGWNRRDAPVFLESFEPSSLKRLRAMTPVRLVQLVDASSVSADGSLAFESPSDRPYDWTVSRDPELTARRFGFFATDAGLREIRSYADAIGPWRRYIVSTATSEGERRLLPPSDLVRLAHAHGLLVHAWTFRNEPRELAADYRGQPIDEYLQFYALGVDGVFSDFADTAVAARTLFALARDPAAADCLVGTRARGQRAPCATGRD